VNVESPNPTATHDVVDEHEIALTSSEFQPDILGVLFRPNSYPKTFQRLG
jgi:hypothetical protein